MRTFVYVDGFNLYYGALKGTSWKWLDLPALLAKVLQPHHDILTVKYFTARVSATPANQPVEAAATRRMPARQRGSISAGAEIFRRALRWNLPPPASHRPTGSRSPSTSTQGRR